MPFNGLRVLSLESRRGPEMATLIRKQGGDPFVASSMRETPLEDETGLVAFADRFLRGDFDGFVFLTGSGTRMLWKALLARHPEADLKQALNSLTKIVRGPKPSAALRELGFTPDVQVPEPNTWRELLEIMRSRQERHLALQEYGQSNQELIAGLGAQGREVTPVRVYRWDLPEDLAPLREAASRLIAGGFDVVLFTTSMQIVNLMRIAESEGIDQQVREALRSAFVGSIGPTTTEALDEYGLKADFEPTHPKMGLLVNEAASLAAEAVTRKI
jgi:uroporphyrinogen-III synthase